MQSALLDYITLEDGTTLEGIVDHVTSKYVYFFDFTGEINPDYIVLTGIWKTSELAYKRFSVFCLLRYPHVVLPKVNLLPTKYIIDSNRIIIKEEKRVKKKKIIKD